MTGAAEQEQSRFRWRCRRGMRELDVLLERYMDRRYGQAGATERAAFQALLELQDPLLIDYLMGRVEASDPEVADVVARILDAGPAR